MHAGLILLAIALAWGIRQVQSREAETWDARWRLALRRFLLPPLLLITTAIATLCMGTQGQMLGIPVGWIGYSMAIAFLGWVGVSLAARFIQAWRSLQSLPSDSPIQIQGHAGYVVDLPAPFAAQIGLWSPRLLVSHALLDTLSPAQIEAVLQHEHAHAYYRDPFWFFWLGWIRHVTAWLPQTEALWQELLLLRELRADQWAAQRVDSLTLAEALLAVVATPAIAPLDYGVPFSAIAPPQRLTERIDALLAPPSPPPSLPLRAWFWSLWTLVPLGLVLLHSYH